MAAAAWLNGKKQPLMKFSAPKPLPWLRLQTPRRRSISPSAPPPLDPAVTSTIYNCTALVHRSFGDARRAHRTRTVHTHPRARYTSFTSRQGCVSAYRCTCVKLWPEWVEPVRGQSLHQTEVSIIATALQQLARTTTVRAAGGHPSSGAFWPATDSTAVFRNIVIHYYRLILSITIVCVRGPEGIFFANCTDIILYDNNIYCKLVYSDR